MYRFKRDEIILLLGAGASVDAKIPHSRDMINRVEKLISEDKDWTGYCRLYNYIKSSIFYSSGIQGIFDNKVNYNIERLVYTLEEISKKSEHTLYPFVGSWNPTLIEVAGEDFKNTDNLRAKIIEKLRTNWIAIKDISNANYFTKLVDFQEKYQHPLRVFTLNYDLCIERACAENNWRIERGFNDERIWDWRKFDQEDKETKNIYLYKLHGSTDWYKDENENLTFSDEPSSIISKDAAIIFGTTYKFQYRDPYLFLAYEFRKWTLESKLIVSIGYGFGDDHINWIIHQALINENKRILLVVVPLDSKDGITIEKKQKEISEIIKPRDINQIKVCDCTAKKFFNNQLDIDYLSDYFPIVDEPFPIVENA